MTKESTLTTEQRSVLLMVLPNALAVPIMLSSVNVALPDIASDLNLSAVAVSWVPTVFLMASAMFVLIFGRVADMYGRKKVFLMGAMTVIVASLMASMAVDSSQLLVARFLQGFGAAMLYATQMALISSVFPPQARGRAIGWVISLIYIGLAVGPLLGGIITEYFGWRPTFYLQIPLAFAVLYIGIFKVKKEWAAEERGSFDVIGAGLYAGSIALICLGIAFMPQGYAWLIFIGGIAGVLIFFSYARRAQQPLWNVSLFFTNRLFTFSCMASLIMYSATFMNVVLVSLYLQYIQGMPAMLAGSVMMVQPLVMAIFSPLVGRYADQLEPRWLASSGMLITAIGLLALASLGSDDSVPRIVLALFITGFGFSLFSTPNVNAMMGSVENRFLGAASSAVAITRILGQMASMVLVTLLFALFVGDLPFSPDNFSLLASTIRIAFYLAALLCLPGLVFSLSRGKTARHGELKSD